LTCYTPAGIDAIKKALRAGEKQSNEAVPIKAKLVAPPLYVLSTNSTDKVYFLKGIATRQIIDDLINSTLRLKD
jgi:translation initiation factor 2 alpha subunit (eIF-2alpha)